MKDALKEGVHACRLLAEQAMLFPLTNQQFRMFGHFDPNNLEWLVIWRTNNVISTCLHMGNPLPLHPLTSQCR